METIPYVPRAVLVANQKGGVGKSSIVAGVASMVASGGKRVLVVDADPQGNVSKSDFGQAGDQGKGLAQTLHYSVPLSPLRDVRPNLDLLPGGSFLSMVSSTASSAADNGIDLRLNLVSALYELWGEQRYDLILIDSGPGDAPLLDALLGTAQYLIVPTKQDDASLDGVELLAQRYLRARQNGAEVQLLGMLLFDANPRATVRNQEVLDQISDILHGSGVDSFQTLIRTDAAGSIDSRRHNFTPSELVAATQSRRAGILRNLRNKGEKADETDSARLWSRDSSGLAGDYQALTNEILTRIAERETAALGVVQ